ncbi:DUF4037 domain-containing protein [Fimbriimonas ginsengisoli]|uniref:DUF4037 domain-containing protein n=1 Tax=Fimbriimonas ginsengisoli Gsoil 348 TaxID=661478 RepID=A0A068NP00_FIMGI|nr:DUF4037 domain-containing protein [Fimbriimonas ginsengisoli]AIE84480.1 hypothetical protein OP10G_1112 [Fimbriimonas ginsengisoli Gsoil 348]
MESFIPGSVLNEGFFREAVRPILADAFPELPYAAARIGGGSDVLGFDTEMSMDHDWGPRLDLFLSDDDLVTYGPAIVQALGERLPARYRGLPTRYGEHEDGTTHMGEEAGRHGVEPTSMRRFFEAYLAFDIDREIEPADWLTVPQKKLRTVTSGSVFYDEIGLKEQCQRFAYYPRDVWLYQLASAWERVGQEEHLVGRAGFVGDEIGASIIAARLVRDLTMIAFLIERVYAPYPKWFGTAFARLRSSSELGPLLTAILSASGWQERDARLVLAYEYVARMQNGLGLTEQRTETAAPFFGRPFNVIHLHAGFAGALEALIVDPEVKRIAARRKIGGIDLFSDSTDLISHPEWRPTLRVLFE